MADVVHDLRAPLSVIVGYAALLREQPLPEPATDFVEAILRGARELEDRLAALAERHEVRPPQEVMPGSGPLAADVLCIEDDRGTAALVTHVLDSEDGISVVTVADGASGLDIARERPPDLVLLDLFIGGMGGEDVLIALRADERTARVPVIVASGAITDATSARLIGLGADAVIAKPFLPDDLRRAVRTLLDRTPGPDALDPRYIDAFEDLDDPTALVFTMVSDARTHLRSLRTAVDRSDGDEVARRAHALRGGMANLGAHVVADEAVGLEVAVREGRMTALPALFARLETAMDDAESALHRRLPALRDQR